MTKQRVAAASLAFTAATSASAHSYPGRPVQTVVPYTSGSPVDQQVRAVAQDVSARVGQPIIIDSRAGA